MDTELGGWKGGEEAEGKKRRLLQMRNRGQQILCNDELRRNIQIVLVCFSLKKKRQASKQKRFHHLVCAV